MEETFVLPTNYRYFLRQIVHFSIQLQYQLFKYARKYCKKNDWSKIAGSGIFENLPTCGRVVSKLGD